MDDIINSLIRYREHHIPTGSFLQHVLSNDLLAAMASADRVNRQRIHLIVEWITGNLPRESYGSPGAVSFWLKAKHNATFTAGNFRGRVASVIKIDDDRKADRT